MPISMSRSARYVTQASIYNCPMLGPLTDRKIQKYQKEGRLPGKVSADQRPKRRKDTLAKLLDLYK